MEKITAITEEELLHVSAQTGERFERFVRSKRVNMQELASLSRTILEEMGRETNMVQDLIMMSALRDLRDKERLNEQSN